MGILWSLECMFWVIVGAVFLRLGDSEGGGLRTARVTTKGHGNGEDGFLTGLTGLSGLGLPLGVLEASELREADG